MASWTWPCAEGVDVGGGAGVGLGCHCGLGVIARRLDDGARADGDVGCCGGGCGLESGDLGYTGMAARDLDQLSLITVFWSIPAMHVHGGLDKSTGFVPS